MLIADGTRCLWRACGLSSFSLAMKQSPSMAAPPAVTPSPPGVAAGPSPYPPVLDDNGTACCVALGILVIATLLLAAWFLHRNREGD